MQTFNNKHLHKDKEVVQHKKRSFIVVLEHTWIIFMLLLISSFYWWGRIDLGVLKPPLVAFFLPVIVILWTCSLPLNRSALNDNILIKKTMIPLIVMIWGMIFSILNTKNVSNSIGVLFEIMCYVFFYFLMLKTIRSASTFSRITITLILCISYFALDGLYRFFISKTLWRLGAGDVLTSTNMGAFMFQAAIILITSKIIFDKEESKASKIIFIIMLCTLLTAFLFTYSRGAWITSIIGFIVLINYRKILIIPIILIVLLIIPFLPKAIINRAASTIDSRSISTVELYRDVE